MRHYCIWRTASTSEQGTFGLPDRCRTLNCNGEFRRKPHQSLKRICENFRPDIETIFRTKPKEEETNGKPKQIEGSF